MSGVEHENADAHGLEVARLRRKLDQVAEGGGREKVDKLRLRGKMTARERIAFLLDDHRPHFEIGALAAYGMYAEHGSAPSAGVVVVLGYVSGRLCVVVANDASVKAGAWFPMTARKNLRAQELAMENRIPIIYLVDSAGVYLPMQDEIFPDREHFGRIFRNNAVMSAMGIVQIAAVMGSCVAGGAYLPVMSDESLIVEGTGSIFLAGPHLVKAAIGEMVDQETLGGASAQTEISGIIDHKMPDDQSCLHRIREIIAGIAIPALVGFQRHAPTPPIDQDRLLGLLPHDRAKPYSMINLLRCLVDDSALTQYKEGYGKTIICAYARIDGWSVGIVANNRELVRSRTGEMQFGGVIYSDSADKAARFIMLCNQKKLPLVFVHDVTGFMVGKRSEHGGIIKDGAKMVNAVANSTVPKFSIVVGNSYGAGNYAMCGRAYDPRLMVAWPSARLAVMGGDQAAQVLTQIQVGALQARGESLSEEDQAKIYQEISTRYQEQTSPYYAAARLWIDAIIEPSETRKVISLGIAAADHGTVPPFQTGVLQV